ncbi:MAG: TolC family protein [Spirochaetia bacterium]|nr:TolC family protein [Spirochaetia bacterium]
MNNKFYGSLFLILLLIAAAPLTAQSVDSGAAGAADAVAAGEGGEPLVLSPAEAFERAYRHDLSQWQNSRRLEMAATQQRWRYLQLLPEIEAQGLLASREQLPTEWSNDLSASLRVTFSASSIAELERAKLRYTAAVAELENYRREFRAELYQTYYRLLLLQEEIKLQEKQLASARARLEAAQYDFESGRISEYELLSARLTVQEQKPQIEASRIEYSSIVERFKQNLGLPEEQDIELSGLLQIEPAEVPALQELIEGLERGPGLQADRAALEQQRLSRRMLHSRYLPQLSISLSRGVVNSFEGSGFTEYDSAQYALSLSFSFNDLLPGSEYRNARHTAETQVESARRRLRENLQNRQTQLQETSAKLQKAERDIEAAQLKLELAERFYRIAQEEYESGRRDLLEVEDAEVKRSAARLDLLRAYYNRTSLLITLNSYTRDGR